MSDQPTQRPVCAIVGVGPGNGAAFARRFAAEGYAVALLARTTDLTNRLAQELSVARAYACDVGDPVAVEQTFASIESDLASVDVLIYNAGKGVWGSAEEVTLEDFEAAWRTNTFGAFAAARSVKRDIATAGSAYDLHHRWPFGFALVSFMLGLTGLHAALAGAFRLALVSPALAGQVPGYVPR
jgi:NAD(P)-dependent dehydrogenase (short-subunit alcohol dehydrogenase family)